MAGRRYLAAGGYDSRKKSAKKPVSAEPRGLNDDSGPPVLRRAATAEQPKTPETPPAPTVAQTPGQSKTPETPPTPPVPQSPPQPQPAASAQPATPSPAPPQPATATPAAQPPSDATPPPDDPNRPTLKRGKPAPKPPEPLPSSNATSPSQPSRPLNPMLASAAAKATPMQLIPAISDADGPESQSYKYEMKPDDESQLRTKVLTLAADEVRARAKQLSAAATPSSEPAAKPGQRAKPAASRPPQPAFTDVQFWAFDLSNSNEPILILTATAQLPPNAKLKAEPPSQTEFLVTLVARQDINGDFHKVLSNVTDAITLTFCRAWTSSMPSTPTATGAASYFFGRFPMSAMGSRCTA